VLLTRLDQCWWPELGLRKADVVDYYRRIAPALVPHLRKRPFTMKRHFNGPRSPFEWRKDAPPEMPSWIPVSPQPARSRGGELIRYPVVKDELALLWMLEYGCIDLHVWTSRMDLPHRPDIVLFDLDPAGVAFADVARAALLLRAALETLGIHGYPMTTGGEGLHVRVPIARRHTHEEARSFSKIVAGALVRASKGLVTLEQSRARRRGVFIDTKMNGHGQQIVAPYSVRPTPAAGVATPLRWEEINALLDPEKLGMAAALERVEREGDVAQPLLAGGQGISSALRTIG
jgi:bifunctional non-homologous end joining protein LigD